MEAFESHEFNFEDSYEVFNILTKNVLSSNSAKEFLAADKGEKA